MKRKKNTNYPRFNSFLSCRGRARGRAHSHVTSYNFFWSFSSIPKLFSYCLAAALASWIQHKKKRREKKVLRQAKAYKWWLIWRLVDRDGTLFCQNRIPFLKEEILHPNTIGWKENEREKEKKVVATRFDLNEPLCSEVLLLLVVVLGA